MDFIFVMPRKRKAAAAAEPVVPQLGPATSSIEAAPVGKESVLPPHPDAIVPTNGLVTAPDGTVVPPPEKKKRLTKKEMMDDYVENLKDAYLPSLKKRLNLMSKVTFTMDNFREWDAAIRDPKNILTSLLPLFHFLQQTVILCDGFQQWERPNVSTNEGIDRLDQLSSREDISDQDHLFLMNSFGKRWWKIPARDINRVKTAFSITGTVKVHLMKIEKSSFYNNITGELINCLNPVMRYEPYVAPPPKVRKPKEPKPAAATTEEAVVAPVILEEKIHEDNELQKAPSSPAVYDEEALLESDGCADEIL